VFFTRRGHAVYRVSSAKAADLRRFLHRHAKSNGIDAETLARMPLADPGGLQQLELPGADAAALDRRVRACAQLTQAAGEHKTRIKDLVRQLMPMTPLTGDIGKADLAGQWLRRWLRLCASCQQSGDALRILHARVGNGSVAEPSWTPTSRTSLLRMQVGNAVT
jgi:transposase